MKLGVLGGTFNPVHVGHLINAAVALDELKLDRVLFVPARDPVHKGLHDAVTPEDRFEMLVRATGGNSRFAVSRIELDRVEPSYSIITVRELALEYPGAEMFLLVGADSFNEMHTWKDYAGLVSLVTLAVMRRPAIDPENYTLEEAGAKYVLIQNPLIEISSTEVRARVGAGRSIRYMVPDEVGEYIKKKGLYRD